jgi:hypothetical protein
MEEIKCNGKTIFLSERMANTAKNQIRKTSHRNHIPKRSYFCKDCGRWHLTSKNNWPNIEDNE